MELRNKFTINYNETDATRSVRLGIPPFLPSPRTPQLARGTMAPIDNPSTHENPTVDGAHNTTVKTVTWGELFKISKESYRDFLIQNTDDFHAVTTEFLNNASTEIEGIEQESNPEPDTLKNLNNFKTQTIQLLEVIDDSSERAELLNTSLTDLKVKFEQLISTTEKVIIKNRVGGQSRSIFTNYMSTCPTQLPQQTGDQVQRTSSRLSSILPVRVVQEVNRVEDTLTDRNRNALPYSQGQDPRQQQMPRETPPNFLTHHESILARMNAHQIPREDDACSVASRNSLADTFSECTFDGSWRLNQYTGTDLHAITVHDAMMNIAFITKHDIGTWTEECVLKAMDTRDVPQLRDLTSTIMKNADKLSGRREFKTMLIDVGHALKAAYRYIATIDKLIRLKEIHIKSENAVAAPLILERFDGFESKNTDVFEFLHQLSLVCKGMKQSELAEYLYCNYISPTLQQEMKHIRHNFVEMRNFLLGKYGKINRLLKDKKLILKELQLPTSKSPKPVKLSYLNRVIEILQQLESLVLNNKDKRPTLESEVYNYDTIMDLVSHMAEPYKGGFLGEYVKHSTKFYDNDDLPGDKIFPLLLNYMKGQSRKLDLSIATTIQEEVDKKGYNTKTINTISNQPMDDDEQYYDEYHSTDEEEGTMTIVATTTRAQEKPITKDNKPAFKYSDDGLWHQATCFMHDQTFTRVKECPMGGCSKFLTAKPAERAVKAEEKKRCNLCFMKKCRKKTAGTSCQFQSSIEQSLICKACLSVGDKRNVLLCDKHDSTTVIKREDLEKFLAGYKNDVFIQLKNIEVLKLELNATAKVVAADKDRKNCNAFNVTDGTLLEKTDILHKISKESEFDNPLFLLQSINIGGEVITLMFDSGASGEVCTTDLAEKLKFEIKNPKEQFIRVASGKVVSTGGCVYSATLGPDTNGHYHEISITGMTKITNQINHYNLEEIIQEIKINQSSTPLSKEIFPPYIGGTEVQMIIGVKQSALLPTLLLVLPTGVSVWRSRFTDIHGSNLIISGPHHSLANQVTEPTSINLMFTQPVRQLFYDVHAEMIPTVEEDIASPQVLQFKEKILDCVQLHCVCEPKGLYALFQCVCSSKPSSNNQKGNSKNLTEINAFKTKRRLPNQAEIELKRQEEIGSVVDYRCPSCQGCLACKTSERTRDVSIKEYLEDNIIRDSVRVDQYNNTTWARYPFIVDPDTFLKERWNGRDNNYFMALRTLDTIRNKPQEIKSGILKFQEELLKNNYAVKLSDLNETIQSEVRNANLRHYFPWRVVMKPGSTSTPTRMVCDPQMSDFNLTLAKGTNCLNSLYDICIEWRTFLYAFCTDISKMYNSLRLVESEYRYSLYLFSPSLHPTETPEVFVMTTILYGLKPASNQATTALRDVAELNKVEYPRANAIASKSTYMDDSGSGANRVEERTKMINEVKTVFPRGGFKIKVVNLSGEDPAEDASKDGCSTSFAGYEWRQKDDLLSLNHGEINFNKKIRGLKKPNLEPIETDEDLTGLLTKVKLTRRNLLSQTLQVFDLLGIVEPLKAKLKIDLALLCGYDYDQVIPTYLKDIWEDNLKMIQHSRYLTWNRSVVPTNAVDPNTFDLVCFVDAATHMSGTCIYTRFLCKDGSYYSQLLTAKSRSVSSTIPRNEMESALMGAQTLHMVLNRLGSRVKDYIVLTDSEISLFWITNPENRLKSYIFNRVRNIHRLLQKEKFFHISSADNASDVLTRGMVTMKDMELGSSWQTGPIWLKDSTSTFPMRSPAEIRKSLTKEQKALVSRESVPNILGEDSSNKSEMNASLNSLGLICCERFDIVTDCHCNENSACCICSYDPLLLEADYELDLLTNQDTKTNILIVTAEKKDMLKELLNLKYYGFKKSIRLLGLLFRFITRTKHASHGSGNGIKVDCQLCNVVESRDNLESLPLNHGFIPTSYEIHLAWNMLCRRETFQVRTTLTQRKIAAFKEEHGILVSGGRMMYPDLVVDNPELPYFPKLNFTSPVALVNSPLTIALAVFIHWQVLYHPGVEQQLSFMLKILHVENLRFLIKKIRNQCPRCRFLIKKRLNPTTGNQSKLAMLKCPAFYASMIDICGPFTAYEIMAKETRNAKSKEAYFLLFVCLTSSATNICVLEDKTTESITLAILRHSNRYSIPKFLILDNESSFLCLKQARVQFQDLQGNLWKDQRIILEIATPLNHHSRGKVEVKVKLLRELLQRTAQNGRKHSYLMWETVGSTVANMLNNLPIAHCSDRNSIDDPIFLVTPNSLLMGKNQSRSVTGPIELLDCEVNSQFQNINEITRILQSNLAAMVHKYVPGREVCEGSPPLIGEIVVFVMKENQRARNIAYKFGRVISTFVDGRYNKITVKYRNATEKVFRQVNRTIDEVSIILSLEDLKFDTMHQQLFKDMQLKYLY